MNTVIIWTCLGLATIGLAILSTLLWRSESRKLDEALTLLRREPTPCEQGSHYFLAHQAVWVCAECGHREPRDTLFYDQVKDRASTAARP